MDPAMSAGGGGARSSGPGAAQAVAPDLALVKHEMDAEEYDMPQHGQEQAPPPDMSLVKVEVQIDYDDEPTEDEDQAWQPWSSAGPERAVMKAEAGAQEPDPLLHAEPPMPRDPLVKEEPLSCEEEEPPAAQFASSYSATGGKVIIEIENNSISDQKIIRNSTILAGTNVAKKFKCDYCEYRTDVCSHYKRHMRTHTGEKPYSCNQCEYRTAQNFNLKEHMRIHTGEKPYSCDHCPFRTAHSKDLKQHMRTHTGEKPFTCDQCEYRASQKIHLINHYSMHTGMKPYGCDQCDYRTAQICHLKRHMMAHTGEKPFKCDLCEYGAVRNSDLKRHMKTHTKHEQPASALCADSAVPFDSSPQDPLTTTDVINTEKPYGCNQCAYRTAQVGHLKRHMMGHTGEKPFKCDQCEYRAVRNGDLKRHMNTHAKHEHVASALCVDLVVPFESSPQDPLTNEVVVNESAGLSVYDATSRHYHATSEES